MTGQRQRKQRGKYYTPRPVADFCWQVLRSKIPPKQLKEFRVVDPAAGDGVFLQEACVQGWVKGENATGVELYPRESAGGSLFRTVQGNGLLDCLEDGFAPGRFDLVVGNPPYGGEGIRGLCLGWADPAAHQMLEQLFYDYDLCRFYMGIKLPDRQDFAGWLQRSEGQRALAKLAKCPIEVLFLERFVRLSREGGWCALVLPEGILANDRMRKLREWVEEQAEVLAVVALDRGTFQREGAAARTALLFLQRKPCPVQKAVYVAAPYYGEETLALTTYLARAVREICAGDPPLTGTWVLRDQWDGRRWDPGFWHPRFRRVLAAVSSAPRLGEFIDLLTYGPIRSGQRPEADAAGIPVIGQGEFAEAGLDLQNALRIVAGSTFDPPRSRVRRGDLLFPRSGEGSLLRFKAGVYDGDSPANVSCFVDLVRLNGIDPYYVWLVLKTRFLREQILRSQNGVGTPNLNFQEIRDLRIPWLSEAEQACWRGEYLRRVAPLHQARLEEGDPKTRIHRGQLADQTFRGLVEELELRLMTLLF